MKRKKWNKMDFYRRNQLRKEIIDEKVHKQLVFRRKNKLKKKSQKWKEMDSYQKNQLRIRRKDKQEDLHL